MKRININKELKGLKVIEEFFFLQHFIFVGGMRVVDLSLIANRSGDRIQFVLNNSARTGTAGDGHRSGAVKERSQTYNPKTEQYVKRDTNTGRFMDVKQDGTLFKGVRKKK